MIARLAFCLLVVGNAMALQGCVAAAVGAGAATVGAVAYDRRTTGTIIDDQSIEFKVYDALHSNKALWDKSHVAVTSYNNVVLLTGETPDEATRVEATALAQGVVKVRQVHNELRLAAPSSLLTRSSDTWVTSKVKSTLLADKGLAGVPVKVVTESGTVYLMGLVSKAEAEKATNLVRRIGGVQRVVKVFEYKDTG